MNIILKGALINTKRNRKIHCMAAKLTSRSGYVHLKRTRCLSKFGDLETHPTAQLVKSQLFGIEIGTGLCSTGTGLFRERLAQLAMAQW